MEISDKVAYLKGLAEGLALDTESKEGKLIAAIIDVLDDMSGKFEDLEDELCDVEDGLDAVIVLQLVEVRQKLVIHNYPPNMILCGISALSEWDISKKSEQKDCF